MKNIGRWIGTIDRRYMASTIIIILIINGINDLLYIEVWLPSRFTQWYLLTSFPINTPKIFILQTDTSVVSVFIIFGTIFYLVVLEEIIFRLIPISIGVALIRNRLAFVAYILFISAVFGYYHGHLYNILSQGVSGVLFAALFLKGCREGGYTKAMYASVMAHLVNNIVALWFINDYQVLFN